MYDYKDITGVQIEITEKCNAACPACSRTYYGYGELAGIYQKHMSLDEFKLLLPLNLISNLDIVIFCGNVGDAQVNPNLPQMLDYLYFHNKNIDFHINTNGGMHNAEYWANFAKYKNMRIWFAVDGTTQEVHSYYRRNTNLSKVLENAKAYIDAGGHAILQFILFEHNQHQLEDVKKLAKEYNFKKLDIIHTDRAEDTPIYNSKGEYVGQLRGSNNSECNNFLTKETENIKNNTIEPSISADYFNIKEYKEFLDLANKKYINRETSWQHEASQFGWVTGSLQGISEISDVTNVEIGKVLRGLPDKQNNNRKIDCLAIKQTKIFITADGFVYPCCMMGHNHTRIANAYTYDLRALLKEFGYSNDVNHVLKHGGIEEVFKTGFFDTIANTWIPNTLENKFLQNLNADYGDCGNLNMCAMACSNCDYNA
jgi:MoaA/NifB/PqqE/SkfB family radical SAM enzyme